MSAGASISLAGLGIPLLLWVLGELKVHAPKPVLYCLLALSVLLIVGPWIVVILRGRFVPNPESATGSAPTARGRRRSRSSGQQLLRRRDQLRQMEAETVKATVSDKHRDELRKSLACLRSAVQNGAPCAYGDTDVDAESLRSHCPWLIQELKDWDVAVTRRDTAAATLLDHMEAAASTAGLAEPTFYVARIVDFLHAQIARRAATNALNQPVELIWRGGPSTGEVSPSGIDNPWLDVPKGEEEPVEDWWERVTILTNQVDSFVLSVQKSTQARDLVSAHAALGHMRPSLLMALQHAEKKDSYREVDGCPVCEINRL